MPNLNAPKVSVIVPAYNAVRFLRFAVESVLAQSFTDFELIVVDDCSTDATPDLLARYRDPRLRVHRNPRNLGVVGARNRAMELARGRYVAAFDADDICLPTRLAKQVAFLDANPAVVLIGTASTYLQDGELRPGRRVANPTALMLRWMLHTANPLPHPSLMYRAETIRALGVLLREEFKYAEDFDLHHRVLRKGEVGFIDEPLIVYRRHEGAITARHGAEVIRQTARVLANAYREWLGSDAEDAAALVATHLVASVPAGDPRTLERLGRYLERLAGCFVHAHVAAPDDAAMIWRHAAMLWWQAVHLALRSGHVRALVARPPPFAVRARASGARLRSLAALARGMLPFKRQLRDVVERARRPAIPHADPLEQTVELHGVAFHAVPDSPECPPTLHVVVDTEAEFDWGRPFARDLNQVSAMTVVERGQAVFDRYGLRPVYLVDYPVASQPEGFEPLLAVYRRGRCEIGAHLHPWTNPPLEEELSARNSYPGNLPAVLEERKLVALLEAIGANLHVDPKFFKAGRYGVGPHTMEIIARHGILVDFSIMPRRNFSDDGGPDFGGFSAIGRGVLDGRLFSLPMTRGYVGSLAPLMRRCGPMLESKGLRNLRVAGVLGALGLVETVTLTPEGTSAALQIDLIRALLTGGQRRFVLHFHSPSLASGHTPYARTPSEAAAIVARIDQVCRYFFEQLGGVPGDPLDLLPPELRPVKRPDAADSRPAARELHSAWT